MLSENKIENMFVSAVSDYTDSPEFKEIIKQSAVKACNKIVSDCLGDSWGNDSTYKLLKAKIQECLGIGIEKLSIQSFSHMVTEVVQEAVNNEVASSLNKTILPFLERISGQVKNETIKLSEIVEEFKETLDHECKCSGEDMTLEIKERSGYQSTTVDYKVIELSHPDAHDNFVFEVDLSDMKIISFGDTFEHFPKRVKSYMPRGFMWYMFTMVINGVKIELDEDDCNLATGDY